tara:strand:+ start:1389 stop:2795 length:1407 start_codon:yes stop_codon:yes gene_type:complete
MALVDPNIAMGFRQPEFQVPNALAQYAQIQQIQGGQQAQELARYQLGSAQRAEATQNALAEAYAQSIDSGTGAINYNKLTGLLAKGGGASQIPNIEKTRRELEAAELTKKKTLQEIETGGLTQQNIQSQINERNFGTQKKKLDFAWNAVGSASTPQSAIAELTKGVKDGVFDMKTATADIQRLQNMTTPEQYREYRVENMFKIIDAKDKLPMMLPKTVRQDAGGQILSIQDNPMMPGYGQPIAGGSIAKTKSFADITSQGQLAVSQRNATNAESRLTFDKEKAEQPQFNAQAGGFIAPPTKQNPQGVFIPATSIQAAKDQSAAVKALQSAGYNVETGEDTISKLIAKSTSGGLQAGGAATLAFFGKSTEGRNAIAALEGTANQIATDLAGGKLGAGISNTDRDFIVAALGDVANPNKTSDERLAGWTAAKNRMMLTGLIPPPKAAAAAPTPYSNLSNEELLKQLKEGK